MHRDPRDEARFDRNQCNRFSAAQREELEREISRLKEVAVEIADEVQGLAGEFRFGSLDNRRIA